jgi:hypothetical protein
VSQGRDFWLSCGHHLLDRDAGGGLLVTDEFLKAYLARPEIAPPADACAAERMLHGALLADPRQAVSPAQIAAIADADARENWEVMVAVDAWRANEFATVTRTYLHHLTTEKGAIPAFDRNGDLLMRWRGQKEPDRHDLAAALAAPSWLDPATGGPRT